jgi:hypothetical protein
MLIVQVATGKVEVRDLTPESLAPLGEDNELLAEEPLDSEELELVEEVADA